MDEPARIMMYSQDSYGLGHLRRVTNLANELVRRRPDLSVLLAVDSLVAPFFSLQPRVDFVKLPSVVKIEAGVFRPAQLLTKYDTVWSMRSRLLCEAVRGFCPQVLLVDHMPGGANGELNATLEMIRRDGATTKLVLGLRDIIDDPAVTCPLWQDEHVYDMLEHYDSILVYGSSDVFPTAERYCLPPSVSHRVLYCGYVCNMDAVKSPASVRARVGLNGDPFSEPLVVVTAGGGSDAYRLMKAFLDARQHLGAGASFASLMITGPFMVQAQHKALRDQARELGVQIHRSIGDTLSRVNAANLVVSMAGYNTLSEILRFGKRAIVIPRAGPSAEQMIRARLLAERGLVRMLPPHELTPQRLAQALVEELCEDWPRQPRQGLSLQGVLTAADALLGLLAQTNGYRPRAIETEAPREPSIV
jgi:predicted glycosyltransferase